MHFLSKGSDIMVIVVGKTSALIEEFGAYLHPVIILTSGQKEKKKKKRHCPELSPRELG